MSNRQTEATGSTGISGRYCPYANQTVAVASEKHFARAAKDLSEAIQANENGGTAKARAHASAAALRFDHAHNLAGVLRARLEYLVAVNIDQDGDGCKQAARNLTSFLGGYSYHWLRAQFDLYPQGFRRTFRLVPHEVTLEIPDGFTPQACIDTHVPRVTRCDIDPGREECPGKFGKVNCHYAMLMLYQRKCND